MPIPIFLVLSDVFFITISLVITNITINSFETYIPVCIKLESDEKLKNSIIVYRNGSKRKKFLNLTKEYLLLWINKDFIKVFND